MRMLRVEMSERNSRGFEVQEGSQWGRLEWKWVIEIVKVLKF